MIVMMIMGFVTDFGVGDDNDGNNVVCDRPWC